MSKFSKLKHTPFNILTFLLKIFWNGLYTLSEIEKRTGIKLNLWQMTYTHNIYYELTVLQPYADNWGVDFFSPNITSKWPRPLGFLPSWVYFLWYSSYCLGWPDSKMVPNDPCLPSWYLIPLCSPLPPCTR